MIRYWWKEEDTKGYHINIITAPGKCVAAFISLGYI